MFAFDLPLFARLGEDDIARFRRDGFLIVERFLSEERVTALRESFPKLFAGKFDTGVYPDEWYWREGMSLPDVTRHMANAWKADLTVAKLALSAGCWARGIAADRLVRCAPRPGYDLVEGAEDEADRASSGLVLHGLPRSRHDGDLLGDA